MSANVESFDNFDSDAQIAAHQSGLIRIILEGKADLNLFEELWFNSKLDTFEFMQSSQLVAGSGCTAVKSAVDYSINIDGIPAAGIVDRDSLFREHKWDTLFEIDHNKFLADTKSSDMYVASLWEVEAYMLEPDLLKDWVYGSHNTPPGTAAECATALTRTILECEFLLEVSSFFAGSHADGAGISDAYFQADKLENAQQLCTESCSGLTADGQKIATKVKALIENIQQNCPATDPEKLHFFLRYVDTKRLLKRLYVTLKVQEKSHWTLPPLQVAKNKRPAELEGLLKQIETKYAAPNSTLVTI